MVKITLPTVIAAVAAIATADNTSPSTLPQLTQDLSVSDMCPITGTVTFKNNCPFDLHIWRYDSSVDKAAVLSSRNSFTEPIRQDFRSGLLSYKVATDGRAVHDGYAWMNMEYRFVTTKNSAAALAGIGPGFVNPLAGYQYGVSLHLDSKCKELHKSDDGPLKMRSVECEQATFEGGVEYGFCT